MFFYNPMDPEYVRNPYPMLHRLREEDPVHFQPAAATYFLTRYHDIWKLLRDERALAIPADRMWMGNPEKYAHGPYQKALNDWIVLNDPPRHTRMRMILNKSFTPKIIARLHQSVSQIAEELLNDIAARSDSDKVDMVSDYTNFLPMLVIADQLGVPREHRPQFKLWSDNVAAAMDPITGLSHRKVGDKTTVEMFDYLRKAVEQRKKDPRDDLLSLMIAAEENGDRLNMDELLATCMLLLFAGNETTTGLMGNTIVALADNRDQIELLREKPDLMTEAVEEFVRYETPSHTMGRILSEDLEVGGKMLEKGARVICVMGAANRDPAVFEDPDILDIERPEKRNHIAFGTGHHFCLGSHLARLETRIGIQALLNRYRSFKPRKRIEWRATVALRGPRSLYLDLKPN